MNAVDIACGPPILLPLLERLSSHMRAARGGRPVVKDDRHYQGRLQGLTAGEMQVIREHCRAHGYRAEFGPGGLGGVTLTLVRSTIQELDHAGGNKG